MARKPPPLGPKSLRLTRAAETDLDEIIDHIADQAGIEIASRFADP